MRRDSAKPAAGTAAEQTAQKAGAYRAGTGVRQKVVMTLVATLLVTLTVSTWMTYRYQQSATLDEIHQRNLAASDFIAKALSYHVIANDYHTLELLLRQIINPHGLSHVRVTNSRGTVMAEQGRTAGNGDQTIKRDINLNGERIGLLELRFDTALAVSQIEEGKRTSFLHQILVIAAVLIVELIALTVIIVGPLNNMTRAIRRARDAGDFPDLPVHSRDEFGEMATEFNALHGQLREAHRRLQARVDDANQELKETNLRLAEQAEALKRVNDDLQLLSVTDPLTGLYNMRYFESLASNEIEPAIWRDDTHSILLFRASNLNDCVNRYNQEAAGLVLKAVCQRLRAGQRTSDTLCLLDSGELLLLMRGATIAASISQCDRLLESVTGEPVKFGEDTFAPELHAGIVTIPGRRSIRSIGELMRCARLALNSCRHRAGNCIVHYAMLVDDEVIATE